MIFKIRSEKDVKAFEFEYEIGVINKDLIPDSGYFIVKNLGTNKVNVMAIGEKLKKGLSMLDFEEDYRDLFFIHGMDIHTMDLAPKGTVEEFIDWRMKRTRRFVENIIGYNEDLYIV